MLPLFSLAGPVGLFANGESVKSAAKNLAKAGAAGIGGAIAKDNPAILGDFGKELTKAGDGFFKALGQALGSVVILGAVALVVVNSVKAK